jgi:hypothetical protein
MDRLKRAGLILGNDGDPVVLGLEGINTLSSLGLSNEPTGWSNLWQSVIGGWSATGQQILLNQNQAKIMQTTPYGTTVYQPTGGAPVAPQTPQQQVIRAGENVANTLLLVAGAVVLVVLMSRR